MSFVLDVLCVLIVIALIVRFYRSSISAVLIRLGCVVLSASIAIMLTSFVAVPTSGFLVKPLVEKKASYELADMVSGKHQATAKSTAEALDLTKIMSDCPTSFTEWVKSYDAEPKEVCRAYTSKKAGYEVIKLVTSKTVNGVSKALSYAVLWVILCLLFLLIAKRIELNLPAVEYTKKSAKRFFPPVLGAICGILVAMGVGVFLNWLAPALGGQTVLLSKGMLTEGTVYPILNLINPLRFLARFFVG